MCPSLIWIYFNGKDHKDLTIDIPNNFFISATERECIDHSFFWNNNNNILDFVKNSDILLLGNSRMLHGIDSKTLTEFNLNSKYKIYNFAFESGEPIGFPFEIIKNENITPKFIVVHVGHYMFSNVITGMWRNVAIRSMFYGYRQNFDFKNNTILQGYIHNLIPRCRLWQKHTYSRSRSYENGTIIFDTSINNSMTFKIINDPDFEFSQNYLKVAHETLNLCKQKGIQLILTQVPAPDINFEILPKLANQLNVPYIQAVPNKLSTYDYSHLTKESAIDFTKLFLHKLKSFI
jgi:hypothetical protein